MAEVGIGVVWSAVAIMVETEDVVALTLLIRVRNVGTTTIQKLRPTLRQLEGENINLMMRLEKNLRERVLRGEGGGDVVVREKNHQGNVGETNNIKNDLNPLQTRRKDGKEENHSPDTTSQNPKL